MVETRSGLTGGPSQDDQGQHVVEPRAVPQLNESWRNRIPPPEQFKQGEDIEIYLLRLENWFDVTRVNVNERAQILLSIIGSFAFKQIMNFREGNLLESTYDQLKEVLVSRFAAKQTVLYERVKFRSVKQTNESITEYIAKIKDLAARCKYPGAHFEDILLEKFASSIKNDKIVDALVSDESMTWEKAVKLAVVMEARDVGKSGRSVVDVDLVKNVTPCFRCGRTNHTQDKCKFKSYSCSNCKQMGHLKVMCKSTSSQMNHSNQTKKKPNKSATNVVDINRIQDENSQCAFKVIKINGQAIKFEVDTGAAITVIPKNLAMKFKDVKWGQSNTQIRTACGQLVPVCGEVQVYFNNRNLHVLILENGLKFPLLGRNFLDVLYPNWRETFSINQISIDNVKDQIQSEFNEIFKDDSNTPIKDIEIDIKLKPDCKPVFAKPYELALSKRDIVEKELQNLVEQGIIVPVKYSNWASPIVAVPKRNGGLRICVDFKRTVNPRIEKDHYPLPLIDEILSKIGHGKIFTVLDLKNAFLQLNVKENCREILTINTHKGLFRFKRLPFGIANAPSAFQAELDKILSQQTQLDV